MIGFDGHVDGASGGAAAALALPMALVARVARGDAGGQYARQPHQEA